MRKDSLLDDLVADLKPVHRRSAMSDALLAPTVSGAQLALFLLLGMTRPDMSLAMSLPSFWWKLTSTGLLALAGTVTAILSFDPQVSPRLGLRCLAIIAATSIIIGAAIEILGGGPGLLPARLEWREGGQCVGKIVLLSQPALIGMGLLMRQGAPTDGRGTAWAIGVAAAACGGFVFAFACPHDDPVYTVFWYVIGCGAVALAARLVLPVVARR
jgi:hypothetical protein